ncbi:L,D-transpeptidase family protein [Alkaliphilus peptidifermentans]|uniref:Putative peptidoglycan binding domain-containing protein n=1 Tax=Alkaliphilus peptidifermentans DSM 18978 TaxID=1120976 RepID=A0A1G5J0J8_9FIRM|nr:L,D-transpeptidase family protein [Alkaliphilus peptidifermentans]SCY81893.1 Putative peptidoglycan binding domain-containing protein [Alkaliphilus peptidifermentans DSM 18978]
MFRKCKPILFLIIVTAAIFAIGHFQVIGYFLNRGDVRGLNEYIEWENQMILDNPDYDDLKILVDISVKKLYLLNGKELIKEYTIASGKLDSPSPLGSWKITNKARWGSAFGTRWMGLNVPWGSYGIHGTNKPDSIGYDASAGCIRMHNKDVEDLYQYVKHGTPVAIINGEFGPFGYGLDTIRPGDFGSDVYEVQRRLQVLGYYQIDYLDGKYGPHMENALYQFQKDNGLPKNPNISYETYKALGVVLME